MEPMKISDLIKKLEELKHKHGDLEVLIRDSEGIIHSPYTANHEVAEDYPEDWNMPDGLEFACIEFFD